MMKNLNKNIFVICIFIYCLVLLINCKSNKENISDISITGYMPKEGLVRDSTVAIKIAEIIWSTIYGEKIYRTKPYSVELRKDIWIIQGIISEEDVRGGTPYIEISKKDGRIIKVFHYK